MFGIAALVLFEAFGVLQAGAVCRRRCRAVRVWLGLAAGLMEMMWLPSLWAFAFDFTMKAQLFAAATALAVTALLLLTRGIKPDPDAEKHAPPAVFMLCLLLPAVILSGYLQYTHTLREVDGALHVGQSTYGDLCMHLSFATGLIGQSFPAEYTLLPGNILGYPYLVDALSSTMLIFGTDLAPAFYVPGTLMCALAFWGFLMFAWETARRKSACVLAFVFLVFNGGLGFLYTLDLAGETGFSALKTAITGYYQSSANMPELNLRWVNALCDLLIPQRTLLAGWVCVLPALYLLFTAMKSRKIPDFLALGLFAGPMVMIHTHSFLALGVISLGCAADTFIRDKQNRGKITACFAVYGAAACALALPQLMVWTFPQTIDGGSLRVLFNWVNNNENGTLRDGYFWFWIKNVGVMFLILPVSVLSSNKPRIRALGLGCLLVYILAETVVFQPNVYDNNKLFFVAYIALLPTASLTVCDIYERLKGIKLRVLFAAAFIFAGTASGIITIAAEIHSDYEIFSESQVSAAEYIKENTFEDSVFLTANNHNNAAASLAGREIVCGSDLYLYFHGLDYARREADAVLMLAYPSQMSYLYDEYGIDYVFVSSYEENLPRIWNGYVYDASLISDSYSADTDALDALYPCVYEGGPWYDSVRIYAVSERAREKAEIRSDYDCE